MWRDGATLKTLMGFNVSRCETRMERVSEGVLLIDSVSKIQLSIKYRDTLRLLMVWRFPAPDMSPGRRLLTPVEVAMMCFVLVSFFLYTLGVVTASPWRSFHRRRLNSRSKRGNQWES